MDLELCGRSAFEYHRIPPQILGLYPKIDLQPSDRRYIKLSHEPFLEDLLTSPIHRIAHNRNNRFSGSLFKPHLLTREAPPGAFWQTEHGFEVASPEFTLLNLATMTEPYELLMAAYELCSTFAVFKPCERAQAQLDEAIRLKLIDRDDGWERVNDTNNSPTDLWKREPLTNTAKLKEFMVKATGMRGIKRLPWTIDRMSGITASPFEAQTSMLLSMPRNEGGWSIPIQNNVRIPLTGDAKKLHDATCAYADILIETGTDSLGLVIECQGRSVHDSEQAALSDAERATALTSMGYDVIQITYKQIESQASANSIAKLIHKKAGLEFKPKSSDELTAELDLRRHILTDWNNLPS